MVLYIHEFGASCHAAQMVINNYFLCHLNYVLSFWNHTCPTCVTICIQVLDIIITDTRLSVPPSNHLWTLSQISAHKTIIIIVSISLGANHTLSDQEREAVQECSSKLSTTIKSVSQEHKDIHASISKYGRIIDKVINVLTFG